MADPNILDKPINELAELRVRRAGIGGADTEKALEAEKTRLRESPKLKSGTEAEHVQWLNEQIKAENDLLNVASMKGSIKSLLEYSTAFSKESGGIEGWRLGNFSTLMSRDVTKDVAEKISKALNETKGKTEIVENKFAPDSVSVKAIDLEHVDWAKATAALQKIGNELDEKAIKLKADLPDPMPPQPTAGGERYAKRLSEILGTKLSPDAAGDLTLDLGSREKNNKFLEDFNRIQEEANVDKKDFSLSQTADGKVKFEAQKIDAYDNKYKNATRFSGKADLLTQLESKEVLLKDAVKAESFTFDGGHTLWLPDSVAGKNVVVEFRDDGGKLVADLSEKNAGKLQKLETLELLQSGQKLDSGNFNISLHSDGNNAGRKPITQLEIKGTDHLNHHKPESTKENVAIATSAKEVVMDIADVNHLSLINNLGIGSKEAKTVIRIPEADKDKLSATASTLASQPNYKYEGHEFLTGNLDNTEVRLVSKDGKETVFEPPTQITVSNIGTLMGAGPAPAAASVPPEAKYTQREAPQDIGKGAVWKERLQEARVPADPDPRSIDDKKAIIDHIDKGRMQSSLSVLGGDGEYQMSGQIVENNGKKEFQVFYLQQSNSASYAIIDRAAVSNNDQPLIALPVAADGTVSTNELIAGVRKKLDEPPANARVSERIAPNPIDFEKLKNSVGSAMSGPVTTGTGTFSDLPKATLQNIAKQLQAGNIEPKVYQVKTDEGMVGVLGKMVESGGEKQLQVFYVDRIANGNKQLEAVASADGKPLFTAGAYDMNSVRQEDLIKGVKPVLSGVKPALSSAQKQQQQPGPGQEEGNGIWDFLKGHMGAIGGALIGMLLGNQLGILGLVFGLLIGAMIGNRVVDGYTPPPGGTPGPGLSPHAPGRGLQHGRDGAARPLEHQQAVRLAHEQQWTQDSFRGGDKLITADVNIRGANTTQLEMIAHLSNDGNKVLVTEMGFSKPGAAPGEATRTRLHRPLQLDVTTKGDGSRVVELTEQSANMHKLATAVLGVSARAAGHSYQSHDAHHHGPPLHTQHSRPQHGTSHRITPG